MKAAIFFAIVCCLSVALISAEKCENNQDCSEGECCMQIHAYASKVCKNLRQKDEFCFPRDSWNNGDGFYRFMCPCGEGLACEAEEIKQDGDVTQFINSKCVEKKYF